ncbi:Probable protein kinase UbiB (Ubiquinone biosynthesis protein UbiB) [Durusdinium trenchii]|uniref:Probable protein kinase UbiB (Ubiquinone biosynthesis protein UbiB) n=1 Tax=Durusdinium trenchii TaxID=1381693 RepID=A0ABP0SSY6_9DINO
MRLVHNSTTTTLLLREAGIHSVEIGVVYIVACVWSLWLLVFRPRKEAAGRGGKRREAWSQASTDSDRTSDGGWWRIQFAFLGLGDAREELSKDDDGLYRDPYRLADWWPGRWYEIACIPTYFDKLSRSSTSNNYTQYVMLPDGTMDLVGSSYAKGVLQSDQTRRANHGRAIFKNGDTISHTVQILNGFASVTYGLKLRHVSANRGWVLLSPENAVDQSLFICARTPQLPPHELREAVNMVKQLGFDLKRLGPVSQKTPVIDTFMLATVHRYGVVSITDSKSKEVFHSVEKQRLLTPFVFRQEASPALKGQVKAKFWEGCIRGDLCFLFDFVQREPLWLEARNEDLWTGAHFAGYNGHADLINYFLQQGTNPNARSRDLETPLHLAIQGYLRHVEQRALWQRNKLTAFESVFVDDNCFSHKPHSLLRFEKTAELLVASGASLLLRDRERCTPLQTLLKGLDLLAPLLDETHGAVQAELGASARRMTRVLRNAQRVNVASPELAGKTLRHLSVTVVLVSRAMAVLWDGFRGLLNASVLVVKLVLSVLFFWFMMRPFGMLCISMFVCNAERRSKLQRSFRADCVMLIVLAVDNLTMHKIAQIISSRPDLVDRYIAQRLELLRDKAPPMSRRDLEAELRFNFGEDRSHIFEVFEMEPFAAGTIAQVHRAKLAHGGDWVAVKVVRSSIWDSLDQMLRYMNVLLSLPVISSKKLLVRTRRIYSLLLCQTDMLLEAASIASMSRAAEANTSGDPLRVPRTPRVYSLVTSRNMLTMELIENQVPCSRFKEVGIPGPVLALRIGHFHLRNIFVDGIFHCDLHPGNVLFDPTNDGKITLLDFGIVGELAETDRIHLTAFFLAALAGETEVALEVFRCHFVENAAVVFQRDPALRDVFDEEMLPVIARHFADDNEAWDTSALIDDCENVFRRLPGLQGTTSWASIELSLLPLEGTLNLLHEGSDRDMKLIFQQFVTANHRAMLQSIEGSPHYARIEAGIMRRFSWGAVLSL